MTTTPMTPSQWRAALKAEGVHAAYSAQWQTAGRDSATGKPFGPVHGVAIHHTAGSNSLAVVRDGRSDLPGPLAHAHLAKSGNLTQLSVKRCNHFGTMAQNAYDAVKDETSPHPVPSTAEPVDGNDVLYGLEIENLGNGTDPYPAVQYDQAVRWAAAICRHHGWSADSVIGHKEGTKRKVDPSFNMSLFRAAVAERLKHPASWTKGQTTTTEDDMADLTDAQLNAIARKVLMLDGVIANPNPESADENPFITLATAVRNIEIVVRRIEADLISDEL